MKNRRGVSNIIGSLIVLAVVAAVGSVILFQGLNQINAFNYDLAFFDEGKNQELREDLILQHVRFINGTSDIELYVKNIGTVESTVTSVVMIHNESQEMVIKWNAPTNSTIQLDSAKIFTINATLACPPVPTLPDCTTLDDWNDDRYNNSNYKLSLTTSRGNFFPPGGTVVTPWNN